MPCNEAYGPTEYLMARKGEPKTFKTEDLREL
jgi:hypothetical protein